MIEREAPALLLVVTDPRYDVAQTSAAIRSVAAALGGRSLLVQVRDKRASPAALLAQAKALRLVTRDVGARLVVNGSLDVAQRSGADGIHVPGRPSALQIAGSCASARELLGRDALVTTAAHDDDDVRRATLGGASAVLVSPIFETPGKGTARGLAALSSARAVADAARHDRARVAVYALGGITAENAAACLEAGADGVAAIRALHDDALRGDLVHALAELLRSRRWP